MTDLERLATLAKQLHEDDRLIPRRFPGTPATPCIWIPTRTTSAVVAKASPTLPQNGSTNYGVVLILRVNLSAIRLCNA